MRYSGWWRCRRKGIKRQNEWVYFEINAPANLRQFRRAARIEATLFLDRLQFDIEYCLHGRPADLVAFKVGHDGKVFWRELKPEEKAA